MPVCAGHASNTPGRPVPPATTVLEPPYLPRTPVRPGADWILDPSALSEQPDPAVTVARTRCLQRLSSGGEQVGGCESHMVRLPSCRSPDARTLVLTPCWLRRMR